MTPGRLMRVGTLRVGNGHGHEGVPGVGRLGTTVGVVDAFGVFNTANSNGPANVLIEGSWGHDLAYFTGDPNHSDGHTHNDGLQIQGNSAITVPSGARISASWP